MPCPPDSATASSHRHQDAAAPDAQPAAPAPTLRARHDGWTPARQQGFLADLARDGRPAQAAAAVGLSRRSAYRFRAHPAGAAFAEHWDAAIRAAVRARLAARPALPPAPLTDGMVMYSLRRFDPARFGDAPAPRRPDADETASPSGTFQAACATAAPQDDTATASPSGTFRGETRRMAPLDEGVTS
jgi:hypothetical protein